MRPNPKILTVVGARPQFIKAAPVSLALKEAGLDEVMVNTGQHYDANMCNIFFEQLKLPLPGYHLEIGSGSHGYQTGEGLKRLEPVLDAEKPDAVLVYGDTNATLAGALTAAKMHVPVAHVEAGLRSFNRKMPEEINRIMTDHVSQWLFAPTRVALENLEREGMTENIYLTGDVMMDAALLSLEAATFHYPNLLETLKISPGQYYLLTLHRAETTAAPQQVQAILRVLDKLGAPVIFPVHPRIQPLVSALEPFRQIRPIPPLSYFEMLLLEKSARMMITDSGGVQKEAAILEVPCVTLRNETEWTETLQSGWNRLVGLNPEKLSEALLHPVEGKESIQAYYGDGQARTHIADILKKAVGPA